MPGAFQPNAFQNDAFQSATSVDAEHAAGSGSAFDASISVVTNAEHVSGSGQAYDATIHATTVAVAEHASGTGSAGDVTAITTTAAGHAAGSGTALDPDVDLGTTYVESFGLDAVLFTEGQHDRTLSHFGTQPDTSITLVDAHGPLAAGTTLDQVLAYLYNRAESLNGPLFGVDAFIQPYFGLDAVITDEAGDTYALDAWIAGGASFGLDAIVKVRDNFGSIGLRAYILGDD